VNSDEANKLLGYALAGGASPAWLRLKKAELAYEEFELAKLQELQEAMGPRRLAAMHKRRRAVELHGQGVPQATIAQRLQVSRQYVNRLVDEADVGSGNELLEKT
jgi:site-specific recombinase XerC